MEKSEENILMTEANINHWYVLRTVPKTERRLMQCLNAAGYTSFLPAQVVLKKWNGKMKEVFVPLFPGCLFVEASVDIVAYVASLNSTLLVDNADKVMSIYADKMELPAKFAQLFK